MRYAADDLLREGRNVVGLLLLKPVAWAVSALIVVAALSYCAGKNATASPIQPLRDTVRVLDIRRDTIRDTVTKYRLRVDTVKAVSDSLDTIVQILDDSTVLVQDSAQTGIQPVVIPVSVVANLAALRLTVATQDTLLRWWERKSAADSLAIQARDRLIVALKPPRCSRRCSFILGAASVAGLVYLVK